ncbi:hypothetical protein C8J57DRAFT_1709337 [Mycena rebaudengoi]|nr:hypothetical protein C8J57DRAFT_1709337 [Mycena rebaudengoi]
MSLSWPTPRRPACYSAPPHDTTAASLRAHGTMVSCCRSPPRRLGATSHAPITEVPTLHARGFADAARAPGRISGMQRTAYTPTPAKSQTGRTSAARSRVARQHTSHSPARSHHAIDRRGCRVRQRMTVHASLAQTAPVALARAQGVMSLWFVMQKIDPPARTLTRWPVEPETPMLAHLKNAHSTSSCQDVTDRMYVLWHCSAVSSSMFNSPYYII